MYLVVIPISLANLSVQDIGKSQEVNKKGQFKVIRIQELGMPFRLLLKLLA